MKRKDTILIAVLVNAALLTALFVTAVKRDEQKPITSVPIQMTKPVEVPVAVAKKEIKETKGDEIDQVLKDFAAKKAEETPQKIDFAKELEAITKTVEKAPKETPKDVIEVTVQKGDILARIASNHGTTTEAIMQLNELKTTNLQIGQVLKIKKSIQPASPTSSGEFYVVKSGDNPWSIAAKNQMKVDQLLKLNDLNDEKARRLKPGDKLRIR